MNVKVGFVVYGEVDPEVDSFMKHRWAAPNAAIRGQEVQSPISPAEMGGIGRLSMGLQLVGQQPDFRKTLSGFETKGRSVTLFSYTGL
jgi:hypothetical protein